MTKLKLGPIESDKAVKLTIELPAAVHRDILSYAEIHSREIGQSAVESSKLITAMLERFMATDRGFQKCRRRQASHLYAESTMHTSHAKANESD